MKFKFQHVYVKFDWNTAVLSHAHNVCGCCFSMIADLLNITRETVRPTKPNICYLALYRKNWLTSGLKYSAVLCVPVC